MLLAAYNGYNNVEDSKLRYKTYYGNRIYFLAYMIS